LFVSFFFLFKANTCKGRKFVFLSLQLSKSAYFVHLFLLVFMKSFEKSPTSRLTGIFKKMFVFLQAGVRRKLEISNGIAINLNDKIFKMNLSEYFTPFSDRFL